jgi:pimeloyl-ACP methyl ester carboxylesterase
MLSMYQAKRSSTSSFIRSGPLKLHLRHWGDEAKPLLLLCHGWMDVGASFQFLVDDFSDAFFNAHHIVALDSRGYGLSDRLHAPYYFPDYLADLDAAAQQLSPNAPFKLLGHSMGGNVVMLYAGARPDRVSHLFNLEGFGLPQSKPEDAPKRYAKWLDEVSTPQEMRPYASLEKVAERLIKTNPRLDAARAQWLAPHWAEETSPGVFEIRGDAAHKIINPVLYRVEEVLACWREIKAPVLAVEGTATELSQWWGNRYSLAEYHERLKVVPRCEIARLEGAGHMLHHERSAELAGLIESFSAKP